MRIAIMTYSYAANFAAGRRDTAGAIRHAHALGVDAVEVMDRFVSDDDLPRIREALTETGSHVVCYNLADDFAVPDAAARRIAVERLRRGLERAVALGAPRVMLFPGTLKAGMAVEQAREWIAEGLRTTVADARALGLTPTLENLGIETPLYGRSADLLTLCAAVGDDLRLTFDAGNCLLAGEDPLDVLTAMWPCVVHVHVKNWSVVPTVDAAGRGVYPGVDGRIYASAALGEGVVDLAGVLRQLRHMGYVGDLAVEYEGAADPGAAVARGVAYLRAALDSDK